MQKSSHVSILGLAAFAVGSFAFISSVLPVQPAAVAVLAPAVGEKVASAVVTQAKTYTPPQSGVVLGASTEAGITQAEVDQKLSSLRQEMASLISSMVIQLASPALPAQVSYSQYSKQLDRIFEGQGDSLDNITASDIPVLPYLSTEGGSMTGSLVITDSSTSSMASVGADRVTDGTFTSDPSSAWALGSGWSWDSGNSRVSYTGTGGAIAGLSVVGIPFSGIADTASIAIDNGGSGYTNGDTITVLTGSADATYTVTTGTGGRVTALTVVSPGTAYTAGTGKATSGGTGTGLVVSVSLIADGNVLTQTIPTDPSDPTTSFIYPRYQGDLTFTGTPYRVAFTIQNYSGSGKVKVTFGLTSSYYRSNGTYTLTLVSSSSLLTFTPTADFVGSITNVSAKVITPAGPIATITNGDGAPAIEMRAGGDSEYNTFVGLGAGQHYAGHNIADQGFNTAFGYSALYSNTAGDHNNAFGIYALFSNTTGGANTALGSSGLMSNTTGSSNTAAGFYALQSNTTGNFNTAVGNVAMYFNTTASFNTAVGQASMYANTTGSSNTSIGYASLFGNRTGNSNSALGYQALYTNTTGSSNTGVGYISLNSNTTGNQNTAMGQQSLATNRTGSENTAVGYLALTGATTSVQNTAVGAWAMQGPSSGSGTANVALGYQALLNYINGSNNTALGYQAMSLATTSQNSVAVGYRAGRGAGTNNDYQGLVALGYQAGVSLQNGSNYNTLVGYSAGNLITTGAGNIVIGAASSTANSNITTGYSNIIIGNNVRAPSATGNYQLNIGNLLYGTNLDGTAAVVSTGNIGIGNATPYARLSVKGTDAASSTLTFNVVNSASTTVFAVFNGGNAQLSGTLTQSSDVRLKEHIESLDASTTLALIDKLDPVTFTWKGREEDGIQVGFIAQDVQKLFPELVSVTSPTAFTPGGTLGVNYIGFIAPIIKSIQALAEKVNSLASAISGFAESFTSKEVHATDQLCVGNTCVTEDQLKQLLQAQGVQSSSPAPIEPEAPSEEANISPAEQPAAEPTEVVAEEPVQDNSTEQTTTPPAEPEAKVVEVPAEEASITPAEEPAAEAQQ